MNYEDVYRDSRFGGLVRRYHTWPTLREQNNAEHSWHVARLYHKFFQPNISKAAKVFVYIMYHDSGELLSGDAPYTAKKDRPALRCELRNVEQESLRMQDIDLPTLTEWEARVVKLCDLLEMFEFGCEEYRKGNSYAVPYIRQTMDHALSMREYFHSEDWERVETHVNTTKRGLEL